MGGWRGQDTNYHSLFVNSDQLGSQTSWTPGDQPFPLQEELQGKIWEIKQLIYETKRLTNVSWELQDLVVRRVLVPAAQAKALGRSVEELTNQWAICLTFAVSRIFHEGPCCAPCSSNIAFPPDAYFVMLLDGTYGFEKTRPLTKQERLASQPKPVPKTNRIPDPDENSPYEKIRKARFKIPRIQWSGRAFPLDLSAEAARAKEYLVKEKSIPADSLRLQEIQIQDPFPRDKVREQALDAYQSYPWVVFRFSRNGVATGRGSIEVYMLLDGTILSVMPTKF